MSAPPQNPASPAPPLRNQQQQQQYHHHLHHHNQHQPVKTTAAACTAGVGVGGDFKITASSAPASRAATPFAQSSHHHQYPSHHHYIAHPPQPSSSATTTGTSYATATDHQIPHQSPHHLLHPLSASLGSAPPTTSTSTISTSASSQMARLQTHFAQLAPSCSAHLADQNAVPILTTSPHHAAPSLSSLSAAFVQAHDTASRMGLGVPLRVTLATGSGAAVIQTGTLPEVDDDLEEEHGRTFLTGNGVVGEHMMLVGTVVAPADRLAEARLASWGVEEVARKFQKYMNDGK